MDFVKHTIYSLKQRFGKEVQYYELVGQTPDFKTGRATTTKLVATLDDVVVLPSDLRRQFIYDSAFRAVNRQFTEGGLFGMAIQIFLIDRDDIPDEITISLKNFLVEDNKRWEIFKLVDYGESALMIFAKERESEKIFQIIEESIFQSVDITQVVGDVV